MPDDDRLDSWKEIAAYLRRGVRTAQRWEAKARLPVHRLSTDSGSVYAFRSDIDRWWQGRTTSNTGDRGDRDHVLPRTSPGATVSATAVMPMRVRTFLSQAIGLDPEAAGSHANLAVYFFTLVVVGLARPEEGLPAARAAAQRALDLDPDVSHAHAMLATVRALLDNDWSEASQGFDDALRCRSVSPAARFHYATWFLSPLQRHQESLAQLRRGLADEPLYLLGRVHIGLELQSLGHVSDGAIELRRVLDIDQNFGPALGIIGREHAMAGRLAEAAQLARQTYATIPQHPCAVGFLAGVLRLNGDPSGSREVLARLESTQSWAVPRARAEMHLVCNEVETAAEWIAQAISNRDPGIWLVLAGTSGNGIRSTRKWPDLRTALKLPAASSGSPTYK